MWKLFIETFFDLWEIQFDQVWSKKIQNKTAIFILFVNVTTFYSNIFWLVRNPFWSSLIKFDPFWTDQVWNNHYLRQIIASKHEKGWQTSKNRKRGHKSETEVITRRRALQLARLKKLSITTNVWSFLSLAETKDSSWTALKTESLFSLVC